VPLLVNLLLNTFWLLVAVAVVSNKVVVVELVVS
jgi:hypothetical protein